jgi:hypothetical protein
MKKIKKNYYSINEKINLIKYHKIKKKKFFSIFYYNKKFIYLIIP